MNMTAYPTNVRTLTDEELKTLSAELSEAYEQSGEDYAFWTDDDAETRYYEMLGEIRRRWAEANPELAAKQSKTVGEIGKQFMQAMCGQLSVARDVNREYDRAFSGPKIGDNITVRRPSRHRA